MKTAEELNALKEEFAAMNKKLAELTDEELTQVSGGSSRRTDDPEQVEAHKCFNYAKFYVGYQSQTLTQAFKSELLEKINDVFMKTQKWHLADPYELIPIVEAIITMLDTVKTQETPLFNAWEKMKSSLPYLEKMKTAR